MQYTASQSAAIHEHSSNLHLIACAGSGKTQVISQRIITLLEGGIEPSQILAFTYTERAAAELKSRVLRLCKEQLPELRGLVDMYIGTIHGWALKMLQEHHYEYQKFSVLDEIKLELFVNKHFGEIGMKELDMEIFKDTTHFIQIMGVLGEAELAMEDLEVPANLRSARQAYIQTLHESAYFDFSTILTTAHRHLAEDEQFKQHVVGPLRYVIVDEYQDVNPIQESLIRELVSLNANLCVVGDDDQTIYQWRGSDLHFITRFASRYPNVESIRLEENFRSSPAIVDIASRLIANNVDRLPKGMVAAGAPKYERGDVLYNEFDDVDQENQFIADQIKRLRGVAFEDRGEKRGLDYSDFCILLRKWKKAERLIHTLEANGIPFVVAGVNELFRRPEVSAAISIFSYLNGDVDASVVRNSWQSLSGQITSDMIQNGIDYLDLKRPTENLYYGEFALQDIYQTFLQKVGVVEELFVSGPENAVSGNRPEEVVFYNLGMFSQVINDFETVHFKSRPLSKLKNLLKFIRYSADGSYPEGWLTNSYATPNAVQITTIFQAKGLEFPVVFIPGLNKNYLPSQKRGGRNIWHFLPKNVIKDQARYEGSTEDERRLFYVAITRSQKFLFISRAPDGRNQGVESRFVGEISGSPYVFSSRARDYSERERLEPKPRDGSASLLLNFSILKHLFECPYKFKLLAMYGFASILSIRMGYGKSMHNMLMEIHKQALQNGSWDIAELGTLLDRHVHIPYAYNDVLQDIKNRIGVAVEAYVSTNGTDFKHIEYVEKDIQIELANGVIVNGRVDLIKKRQEDGTSTTTIIDFKSAEDSQSYDLSMEQLGLYAVGYDELSGHAPDFVQIYNLDKNRPLTHEINTSQMDALKVRINDNAMAIRNNVLPKTADSSRCSDCRSRKVCSGSNS
jgi:DNA helicase II / ATP-dependent DNA helicase PcrA